ncbi:MAG: hypothetical protein IT310_01895 [Anaerolineales bacterium]|nr:hypothetical protein [Anaerolineales bacterium]
MTTHQERLQTVFANQKPDRAPVALWRHFPNEDQNPETLAQATLEFQRTYDFDLVKVTPASSFAVKDWGVEDEWQNNPEGSRAYIKHVIQKPQDWEKLQPLDPTTAPHLAGQLACLRLIRQNLPPETPLLQTIFNPLSQAKNLAGNDLLIEHLRKYPEAVAKGLETIAQTTQRFISAAIEIGIDGIFYAVQHAQSKILTLEEYQTFGLSSDKVVLEPIGALWCNLLHLHGSGVYFSLAQELPFQIVNWHDRETYPTLSEAQSLFTGALCGGLRQESLLKGNPAQVQEEAADALQQTNGQRFILGTGCVVYYQSPAENIWAAKKSAR